MSRYYQENPYEILEWDSSDEGEASNGLSTGAIERFYIRPAVYKRYSNLIAEDYKVTESLRRLCDYKLYESDVYNWIETAYSFNLWVDEDYKQDYENENKHFVSKYENVAIKLSAGKNADITIIKNSDYVNNPLQIQGKPTQNGIYVEINNKVYNLPLDLDIARVHDLVMVYNYALEQENAALVEVCEKELNDLETGKTKEVKFVATNYISKEEQEYIQQQCEYYAVQKALVENKIIPPESETLKHPNNINDLFRFADKVSNVYKKELQKKNPNLKKIDKISQKIVQNIFLHPEDTKMSFDTMRLSGQDVLRLRYDDRLGYKNSIWNEYELESKQWKNEKGETNYLLRLATGKYSYIDVCKGSQYDSKTNKWVEKTGMYAVINNKRIQLPLTIKVDDVAAMLRLYEVVLSELAKDPNNEVYLQYKKELETNFEKVSKGELKEFPYPKCHYDRQISDKSQKVSDYAKFISLKTRLIAEGKIPAETEKNQYKYRKDYKTNFRKIELKHTKNSVAQNDNELA